MIGPLDVAQLSLTKLRIRKVRLVVMATIASLLFALAVFMVTVVHGALLSVERFNSEGLSNRYLVASTGVTVPYEMYADPVLVTAVEKAQADQIARKKAEAKRLGIEFDEKAETAWVTEQDMYGNGTKTKAIAETANPIVAKIIEDAMRAMPQYDYQAFQKSAQQNGAIATYRMALGSGFGDPRGAERSLKILANGKESYEQKTGAAPFEVKGFATLEAMPVRTAPETLLEPFLLEGQNLQIDQSNTLPVFVPFSVAEESLGLKSLNAQAKPAEKLAHIHRVREGVAGKTISICARNATSTERLQAAITQKKTDEQNKTNKNYVRPDLVYGLPTVACGEVPVIRDVRSAEQKKQDTKQLEFDQIFGKPTPEQRIVVVRAVGILPDMADLYGNTISSILSSVLSSSLGSGWVMPQTVAADPRAADIVAPIEQQSVANLSYLIELPSAQAQTAYIKNQSCNLGDQGQTMAVPGGGYVATTSPQTTAEICASQNKQYFYFAFGNNAAAVDEFEKGFTNFFRIALVVIGILSSLVLMGVIGRIIADGRRETAVFRAIGATRIDIAYIYMLYTFFVAVIVTVLSIGLGFLGAYLFNAHFSPLFTPNALLVFNSIDLSKQFVFFGIDSQRLVVVVSVIFVAAFAGMLLPLLANLRRSPLRDMRDET